MKFGDFRQRDNECLHHLYRYAMLACSVPTPHTVQVWSIVYRCQGHAKCPLLDKRSSPHFLFYINLSSEVGQHYNTTMGIFDIFKTKKKAVRLSSYRYRGRWYGLMLCLGEESGRDMKEKLKDKGSELLTMLELSNEFPKDFVYVNQLLDIEKNHKSNDKYYSEEERQKDYMLGAIEAKKVYLKGKKWELLLVDMDID